MPTLSDFGMKHAERCYKMSDGHQDAPLDENRVLWGRVELEDPGLALGRVLAANDGRAVCLSPWEGGQGAYAGKAAFILGGATNVGQFGEFSEFDI